MSGPEVDITAPGDTVRLTAEEGVAASAILGVPDLLQPLRSGSDEGESRADVLDAMQSVGLRSLLARGLIDVVDAGEPALTVLEPLATIIETLAKARVVAVCQRWGEGEERADVDVLFGEEEAVVNHLPFDLIHELSLLPKTEAVELLHSLLGVGHDEGEDGDEIMAPAAVLDGDAVDSDVPAALRSALAARTHSIEVNVLRRPAAEGGESAGGRDQAEATTAEQLLWFRSAGQSWLFEVDDDDDRVRARPVSSATLRSSLARALDGV